MPRQRPLVTLPAQQNGQLPQPPPTAEQSLTTRRTWKRSLAEQSLRSSSRCSGRRPARSGELHMGGPHLQNSVRQRQPRTRCTERNMRRTLHTLPRPLPFSARPCYLCVSLASQPVAEPAHAVRPVDASCRASRPPCTDQPRPSPAPFPCCSASRAAWSWSPVARRLAPFVGRRRRPQARATRVLFLFWREKAKSEKGGAYPKP